jgi:hypothetical protein
MPAAIVWNPDKFARKKMSMPFIFNLQLRLAQRQLDLYAGCE